MPNRTIPEFWKDDLTLNTLPKPARLLFYLIHHVIEDTHRFPIGPSPEKPLLLHARLYALDPSQRHTATARELAQLMLAGVVLVRDSERGWYGEIAEHMRYRAEDFTKGAPRYGPRRAEPAAQPELRLGPMGVLQPAPVPVPKSKPYDYGIGNDNDSRPGKPAAVNRAQSRGDGESRFAREVSDLSSDALGARLQRFLGLSQMVEESLQSGAWWQSIIEKQPDVLRNLLDEGERVASSAGGELRSGSTKAKWLTKRLHERIAA